MGPPRAVQGGPAPNPLVANPLDVWQETIDELSKTHMRPDYGDVQIAYYNVGLGARKDRPFRGKPNQQQAEDYFRRLVWHATGPARYRRNVPSERARRRRVDICLMAVRTLHQYKYDNWDRSHGRINLSSQDRPRGLPARLWADLPDPLPTWREMSARIRQGKALRNTLQILYQPSGDLSLTTREMLDNMSRKYLELTRYLDACPTSGFTASNAVGEAEFVCVNFPNDGNSLWYSLAYGPPASGRHRESWAVIKSQIWNYFNAVLYDEYHPRHRMYVVLEQQSRQEIADRDPDSQRLWGNMSIRRSLYINKPDSGPPMYCQFEGILQVIADFFGKEVIVFDRNLPDLNLAANLRHDPPREYNCRVYGRPDHGFDRGQILLVTDSTRKEYQIATYPDGHPEQYFDTSMWDSGHRYGWINAPWMTRPLPDGYEPILLPRAPIDDRVFTRLKSELLLEFLGCGNAISVDTTRPWSQGMELILPDPQDCGWDAERRSLDLLPPPVVYEHGRHNVVVGIYVDKDGRDRWPQWDNVKAYEAHKFQQEAKQLGINIVPINMSERYNPTVKESSQKG
ncbi:hypothetical protein F4808DRAFT_466178 [Astrocystis sublimbata]|nr:hypothetical protein F4808DRAFT_466178 [Astrocystis sublimbata]